MGDIPSWHIVGDWFDNCSCAVPCPCTFAQAPDNGFCESVLFWHVREGHYGDVKLDNLSFVRVGRWEGCGFTGRLSRHRPLERWPHQSDALAPQRAGDGPFQRKRSAARAIRDATAGWPFV